MNNYGFFYVWKTNILTRFLLRGLFSICIENCDGSSILCGEQTSLCKESIDGKIVPCGVFSN